MSYFSVVSDTLFSGINSCESKNIGEVHFYFILYIYRPPTSVIRPSLKGGLSMSAGSNSVAAVICVNRDLICLSVLVKASFSEVKSVGRMPLSPMCLFMVSVLCLMLWIA